MSDEPGELDVDEVLTTTRTVRKRLDLARPVERELIEECLTIALQAPNGSARQAWHFVAVGSDSQKRKLAELYRQCLADIENAGTPSLQFAPDDPRAVLAQRILSSSRHLADHLEEVPWLVVFCQTGRLESPDQVKQAGWWGSILPAAWSFMLAARARGLGTAWTTLHLHREEEAAEILGVPYEDVAQALMVPVAYTVGSQFQPAARLPLETVLHWDSW